MWYRLGFLNKQKGFGGGLVRQQSAFPSINPQQQQDAIDNTVYMVAQPDEENSVDLTLSQPGDFGNTEDNNSIAIKSLKERELAAGDELTSPVTETPYNQLLEAGRAYTKEDLANVKGQIYPQSIGNAPTQQLKGFMLTRDNGRGNMGQTNEDTQSTYTTM